MIIVVVRAFILYLVVLISVRIMGKGQMGELEPFDWVVSLMIAELAAMPLEDLNAPLSYGITAIVTLMFLQCLSSFVTMRFGKVRSLLSGRPNILYANGEFKVREMKKLRVNVDDIIGQIRLKGYTDIRDIDYLIMETNGQVSVIASSKVIEEPCHFIPISIIVQGSFVNSNIEKFKLSMDKINKELKKANTKPNEVIYGFIDKDKKYVFIKKKHKNK